MITVAYSNCNTKIAEIHPMGVYYDIRWNPKLFDTIPAKSMPAFADFSSTLSIAEAQQKIHSVFCAPLTFSTFSFIDQIRS